MLTVECLACTLSRANCQYYLGVLFWKKPDWDEILPATRVAELKYFIRIPILGARLKAIACFFAKIIASLEPYAIDC